MISVRRGSIMSFSILDSHSLTVPFLPLTPTSCSSNSRQVSVAPKYHNSHAFTFPYPPTHSHPHPITPHTHTLPHHHTPHTLCSLHTHSLQLLFLRHLRGSGRDFLSSSSYSFINSPVTSVCSESSSKITQNKCISFLMAKIMHMPSPIDQSSGNIINSSSDLMFIFESHQSAQYQYLANGGFRINIC